MLVIALALLAFLVGIYAVVRLAVRHAIGAVEDDRSGKRDAELTGAARVREMHRRAVQADKYPDA